MFIAELQPTMKYIVLSFVIGGSVGILTAFAVHTWSILYRILFPILVVGFVIPKIVLAPLLLLYVGFGGSYFLIFAASFVYFPVLENTLSGLRGIDEDLLDLTTIYQPTSWFRFRHVQFPYSLPYIGAGLKIGMTQAIIGVVIAEIIAPRNGLGSLLMLAEAYSNATLVFATVFVIALGGISAYKVNEILLGRLIYWRELDV